MEELIFISIIAIALFIMMGIYLIYSRHKTYDELSGEYKTRLEKQYDDIVRAIFEAKELYTCTTKEYTDALERLQKVSNEIKEKETFNQTLYQIREEELNNLIENKKKSELEKLDKEVNEWAESAQEAAAFNAEIVQESFQKEIDRRMAELNDISSTINDYKARRDVINEEILRARAIEEQQDFYRIQLPESSKHDLDILQSIRKELTKIDILDKLLYDNYVKKPVDEMIKRVLKGESPCGIYKITRLKTGEIYIGQSTDVKARWQQHTKSAFHCGTISHSILHTTIEKDGIENFTWELLEEVPKDKLKNREKYWIEFYDSKNFGLNERQG